MIKKSIDTPIGTWLRDAAEELAMSGITTALLDAEVLLAHTLRKSRTYLHAHADEPIEPRRLEIANARLELRKERVPVAYIIGHKEFYGRQFKVTPSVLIPRPESEALIETLGVHYSNRTGILVDVGTGSGCLGITAKLEHPTLTVILTDTSRHALKIAEENALSLDVDVSTLQSNLLDHVPYTVDYIIANLPYVDSTWERSPETNHEPAEALFADDGGLKLIKKLIAQTDVKLKKGGLLLLEADPEQHETIITYAAANKLHYVTTNGYCLLFSKP